ncbi:hypothetical protein CRG98_023055 [Punica granatum]|uniref:Chalcone synthase n=1 Tax=Punica granatum TaxID=22663 RepID=A0A2I0JJT6_PUNGR|nr:hypothetical protein CRG98_023055 [Punica granatum]
MGYSQQAKGPATIMAIGTAIPSYVVYQADFPDYYFRLSGCDHMTELKEKFIRICEKSTIRKRHMHLTEEILKQNPAILTYDGPSLNVRQQLVASEVPKLAMEAASKAIEEWGQPVWKITHLVFSSVVGAATPGADYKLIKLLGLEPSVKRVPLYQQGCYVGGTALRIAKDLAENNASARVLVVCVDNTISSFRGPSKHITNLVGQALFSDGASAAIVGADPIPSVERPIFQIAHTSMHLVPDSDSEVTLDFLDAGLIVHVSEKVPSLIADNLEKSLVEALGPTGINDWNSLFWAAHPGGPKILDMIEAKLGLRKEKLRATRTVLREYGNMIGACLLFILDEIRQNSLEAGMATTGEGFDWGILLGFGPGLTVEAVVLRSFPIAK